jgi:pyruvate formate lyase activating enzyme
VIDKNLCVLCGKCTDYCVNQALEYVGKDVSVQELMKEIIKDEVFYDESDGGVTFSGGEPLTQSDFLSEILKACQGRGIHTTVDTSGFTSWDNFKKIVDYVDLFLYDLKVMDKEKHEKFMNVDNKIILENLKRLSDLGKNIFVRMPIIVGINEDDTSIDEAIDFLTGLNITKVNLLPYHKMGMDKYSRLNMDYKMTGMEKPSNERMIQIESKFKNVGIKVKIGG